MPVFRYKSVADSGEVVEGRLEGTDQAAVIGRLHQLGHMPIRVEPASGLSLDFLNRDVFGARHASAAEVTTLTREIATLLQAGLPLDRALEILVELSGRAPVRDLVGRILDRVRGGTTLAEALEDEGNTFPSFYRSMVRAGEAGASLEAVLARLADFMERAQALRSSVRSALIYPTFLLATAGLSVVVLLTFVVPTFEPLFADAGTKLPVATRMVIGVGDAFQSYWWAMALTVVAFVFGAKAHMARPAGRLAWHGRLLKVPLIGATWLRIDVARFSRTLGTLLANGVPLLSALSLTKDVLGNAALAAAVDSVEPAAKAGRGLAEPLAETGVFPRLAIQLLHVGEESGHLEEMLNKLADIYDQETKTAIQRLLSLLVPVLTLALGLLIAFIITAILLALFSINELAL